MALRITVLTKREIAEVRVEGRLDADGVPDLLSTCRLTGTPVRLDLSGLQTADKVGIDALRSLRAGGVEFRGVSLHINQLLKDQTGGTNTEV